MARSTFGKIGFPVAIVRERPGWRDIVEFMPQWKSNYPVKAMNRISESTYDHIDGANVEQGLYLLEKIGRNRQIIGQYKCR
jgi:hypothetical protein